LLGLSAWDLWMRVQYEVHAIRQDVHSKTAGLPKMAFRKDGFFMCGSR